MFHTPETRLPCSGDEAVALFAAYQFGLVSDAQARRSGLGADAVAGRLREGVWALTRHCGVYRVAEFGGAAWTPRRAVMSAMLAMEPGVFACRETAARLWRLDGVPPWNGGAVHVGVLARCVPRPREGAVPEGVRLHAAPVAEAELVWRPPFLLTGVRRTLSDMARCTDGRTFARMLDSAVRRRLVVPGAVRGDAERHHTSRPCRGGSRRDDAPPPGSCHGVRVAPLRESGAGAPPFAEWCARFPCCRAGKRE
ncbi:hypothetical protein [Allosalinactinospora lopnorensis]|uniref:hypothetical protein n=1 Tax=Allosalinactinospora lopnorensis TaxID=1352348 RepID=UPI000623EBE9|nr:hypothetical protein [Allosalinactinospora lopnorensis]